MAVLPRISVVTPSFNQGQFIRRTIESVLAQDYPNFEHIVVDGMSNDDTPTVLADYPHLQVVREPDSGQAEAINKGFRRATGDIFCYLNSDDTFWPGALHRVARALDPARGRHVVMGRCLYIDEDDRPTGLEHPSAFVSHERVLEVWNVHCIPQPATFWTRECWQRCGPMDEREQLVLDFDLMCRFSRHYRFQVLDEVLATFRLHPQSKSCSTKADHIYETATNVSRRYWGPWWAPRYWRMLRSLARFRSEQRHGWARRAAELTVRAYQARAAGSSWRSLALRTHAAVLHPQAAWRRWLLFGLTPHLRRWLPGVPTTAHTWDSRRLPPLVSAWRSFAGQHADGNVGPQFRMTVHVPPHARWLHLDGVMPFPAALPRSLVVNAAVPGCPGVQTQLSRKGPFTLSVPVAAVGPGEHRLEVTSSWFMVPDDLWANGDFRPISFCLSGLRWGEEGTLTGEAAKAA